MGHLIKALKKETFTFSIGHFGETEHQDNYRPKNSPFLLFECIVQNKEILSPN